MNPNMIRSNGIDGMLLSDDMEAVEEMRAYTADFETTTDPDDCRVWAWAICPIDGRYSVEIGNSMDGFLDALESRGKCRVYFHNLAFDGAFLMSHLLTHGWAWVDSNAEPEDMTFKTLINDTNKIYSITLNFSPVSRITIQDSLKVIPLSIAQMAKTYKLPIMKGELDYTTYREPGHIITDDERAYIENDVRIAAMALKTQLDEGMNRLTASSNALYSYKKLMGGSSKFRKVYELLTPDEDAFVRKAYRGGFTYANPKYTRKRLGSGIVLDVNSLYPSVLACMCGESLPYGAPVWFDGDPEPDDKYPLWVACVSLKFDIKPDHIPCVQLKGNWRFGQTEYVEHSNGEVTMNVTSVDWELMLEQYDVRMVEWHGGYKFKASEWFFRKYVEHWGDVKIQATEEGNAGKRQLAKQMLVSLYGKMGTRTTVTSRRPVMHDGVLHYVDLQPEERDPVYPPVAVFTTAWARRKTVKAAQSLIR